MLCLSECTLSVDPFVISRPYLECLQYPEPFEDYCLVLLAAYSLDPDTSFLHYGHFCF